MPRRQSFVGLAVCLLLTNPPGLFASSHREAPVTALDHTADITDLYAFVSYDHPDRVTFIMNVDPFLEPSNGPNYFPFDPSVLYQIKIDNNNDAQADLTFNFRFQTQVRLPDVFVANVGAGNGIAAPANSPAPIKPGTPIVPPAITSLDGPGAAGLNLRQTYTVTLYRGGTATPLGSQTGSSLFAVPSNVGPRTMPDYDSLAKQGIYSLGNEGQIRVFAGTVADPFYIDLGASFDSFNFRAAAGGGVLTPAAEANDQANTAPNSLSGFNVNTIAIEVPITYLTADGNKHSATDVKATIGAWATTSRAGTTVRTINGDDNFGTYQQIQRIANPLVNELLIGTGYKNFWSMSAPVLDRQFASFDLDPLIARVFNAVYGIDIPPPPRVDLLPLVTYAPPIAAHGTPAGPIADLLRLNTGVAPTSQANRKRMGLLAGDGAGFPNGRRLTDDVTDIVSRVVAGGVLAPGFNKAPNNLIGDGVNAPDVATQETFPYVHFAYSGRDSRHIDAGENGCGEQPTPGSAGDAQGGNSPCPIN